MSGLFEIFFSPGKVFDQVRERSMFLPGLIAVILLAVATFAVLVNLVGMETMARAQFESNPRMAQRMTPEQMEQAIQASDSPARKAIGFTAAVLGSSIFMCILAGLCMAGLALVGGKASFKQTLGAVTYSWFPYSLLNLLMTTVLLLVSPDRERLDFRNLLATNVGAFLDKETTNKALLSIANSLDVLSFAEIAFLSYGLSKVSRASFGKCASIVIGLWFIYVAGKAAVSSFF